MTIKQAKHMKYYHRNDRVNPVVVRPETALLPRETFAAIPEVLDAYDGMVRLNDTIREQHALARSKTAAADAAAADYKAQVKDALIACSDPAKIKSAEQRLRAEAAAHAGFAADATGEATHQGIVLGRLLAAHAAEAFPPVEEAMADAELQVRGALAGLRDSWSSWSKAWSIRQRLSQISLTGGVQHPIRRAAIPAEVAAAIGVIDEHLASLNQLKADEAEMLRWRSEQAEARAANAKAMGLS